MIEARPAGDILQMLRAAVESDAIPDQSRTKGAQILDRLTSPIRLSILGHPKSGKSQILNLIAGEVLIPNGVRLPTLELVWGEERTMTLHLLGGIQDKRDEITLDKLRRTDIEMIRITAPLQVLKKVSILEVVTRGTAEDEREGVSWAVDRSDMVLWCSQEFTPAEQWLWSAVPDRLKDHGFLVLTKADELIRAKTLANRMGELQDIVNEEFHSLIPVATLQGIDAVTDPAGLDQEAFLASGGRALTTAVMRHIEHGRRADLDNALLFLNRFGSMVPQIAAPQAPAPVPSPAPVSTSAELRAALSYLNERCANLNGEIGTDSPEVILEHCVDTADMLVDMVTDVQGAGAVAFAQNEVLDASEMMLLMQLEKGDGPAADAVTLLLQLRRTLEQSIAA